jgi:hypothetical protein
MVIIHAAKFSLLSIFHPLFKIVYQIALSSGLQMVCLDRAGKRERNSNYSIMIVLLSKLWVGNKSSAVHS